MNRLKNASFIVTLVAGFLMPQIIVAQQGALDTTFDPGTGANFRVRTTSLQSDGKIIIGGDFSRYEYSSTEINNIARLNTDGTLDTSFDLGAGANHRVWTTSVQSDGKIIIGGNFTGYDGTGRNYIARLNTDGTLDTSFDPGLGANSHVYATSVQSDGKIIIGGVFTRYDGTGRNSIARLNTNGSLDTTFDPDPGTGANDRVRTTSIQSDGKIIIGGDFTDYNGTERNSIARLNTDGSLDTSFTPGTGTNGRVHATSIQSDGKIIIGGDFTDYNGTERNYIARLNTNGTLDPSFAGTGTNSHVYATSVQSDGKIIIGGDFTDYDGTGRNSIARLNTDGSLDTSFDPGTGANGENDNILTTSLQSDGNIIIGGNFTDYDGTGITRIARIIACSSTTGTDLQTACDSYTWIDGNTYTADNNTATDTLTNAAGCDSIVTLDLTINSTTGTDVQTACDSYTWIDGNTYTADNNTATVTLTNAAGCDSIVTLDLTINNSTTGADVQTACGSYTWIDGNTYTADNNTATDTLTNAAGCDSIVTLDLTMNYTGTAPSVMDQAFSVIEYSPVDTDVGTVAASDPDTGQSLTYAITAGNTGNVFAISSSTGAITVNGPIDYNTDSLYTLTVEVTDDDTCTALSSSASVTISIDKLPPVYIDGPKNVNKQSFQPYTIVPDFPVYTYQWAYTDPAAIFSSTTTRQSFLGFANTGEDTLRCIISVDGSPVDTVYKRITVNNGRVVILPNECPEITPNNPCTGSYIDRFAIDGIDNSGTGCAETGYDDFTQAEISTNLFLGNVYNVQLTLGYNGVLAEPPFYIGLWIDYNNNGSFDDAGEFLSASFSADSVIELSNLLISNNLSYQGARRMRVRVRNSQPFTASEGCVNSAAPGETEDYVVHLTAHDELQGPHLITPNADGKNDLFVIHGINTRKTNQLIVYDRLGKVVFKQKEYINDWGGTDDAGNLLNPDTYYYVFENGENVLKGFFQINY